MKHKIIIILIVFCAMPLFAFAKTITAPPPQKNSNGTITYVKAIDQNSDGTMKSDAAGNPVYIMGTANSGSSFAYTQNFDVSSNGKITSFTSAAQDVSGKKIGLTKLTASGDGFNYQGYSEAYDPNTGKLTSATINLSDPATNTSENYTLTYDSNGKVTGKTDIHYDASGKITSYNIYRTKSDGTLELVTDTANMTVNCGATNSSGGCYQPLSPIPGLDNNSSMTSNLPAFLNAAYKIGIGICFVLGVIMFTWAGVEYILSEAMNTKSDAKKKMTAAIIGLAIALGSYILLQTINPNLLILKNLDISAPTTASTVKQQNQGVTNVLNDLIKQQNEAQYGPNQQIKKNP